MSPRWIPPTRPAGAPRQGRQVGRGRKPAPRFRVTLEGLEDRRLLSIAVVQSQTTFVVDHVGPLAQGASSPFGGQGPDGGYTPAQVRKAYGYDSVLVGGVTGDGTGQTVAIVDAFDQPNMASDLHAFDQLYGLPDPPSFTKVNQNGQAGPLPGPDAPGGWGVEESLDVEWVHAIAPMANIVVVEANSAFDSDLIQAAVATAASLPGVSAVSMSFGGGEDPSETQLDPIFKTPAGHAGVTFLASTGDSGSPGGYPAYSPDVVAVGGTTLNLNSDNSYGSETAWSGSGGGLSTTEPVPAYQSSLGYTSRAIPDVASLADPNTGVEIYDTYDFSGGAVIGGTSLACPTWAGLIAIANQERVANGDAVLDGTKDTLPDLYALPAADFNDITSGSNGGFNAGPGYDLVTGRGTPIAPSVIRDLAPISINVTPVAITAVEASPLNNAQVATFVDKTGTFPVGTYTASINWGDGTPATAGAVSSLGNGVFSVTGSHDYLSFGKFTLSVSVTNTSNAVTASNSEPVTVADAPLTASPLTFTGVQGTNFSGAVGDFTDADPFDPASLFTATIDFGDGRVKAGTVASLGNGQFSVTGSNDYRYQGNYPVVVTVAKQGDAAATFMIDSTGQIAPAQLVGTPTTLTSIAGFTFTGTVASFTNPAPNVPVTDYSVSINWGDGGTTTGTNGTYVVNLGSLYDVVASHAYARYGLYTIAVTVSDAAHFNAAGSSVTVDSSGVIADAPIQAAGTNFSTVEGAAFSGKVASFTSSNLIAAPGDYTATINWGDGTTPTAGTVTQPGGAGTAFTVDATHTYAHYAATPYAVTVNVVSAGGRTATANDAATVAASLFAVTGTALDGTAGEALDANVAAFTDAYSGVTASNYTATINWGDGTPTESTADTPPDVFIIQPGGPGTPFLVSGSHAYVQSATYATTVTVTDESGAVNSATGTAAVADAPVIAAGVPAASVAIGTPYAGVVGTFTTPDLFATAGQYIALIDWGDDTSSGGTITPVTAGGVVSPGSFSVTGSGAGHTYTSIADYSVKLTVVSLGGNRDTASSPVNVTDAAITGTSAAMSTVAGTAFSGAVGTFKSYPGYAASSFTASINWGDGSVTPGSVTANANGTFTVSGANTYKAAGSFSPKVTVKDAFGTTGTFTDKAAVADAPVGVTPVSLSAVQYQTFDGPVATFTSGNPFALASSFVALINWGDGSPTDATGVITGSNGHFTLTGVHDFPAPAAADRVTVTIKSSGGATAGGTGSAHVLAPLSGGMARGSDNGVSTADGITSNTRPDFQGSAEPGSTVRIYAAPAATPLSKRLVAQTVTNASGNWSVLINPLGSGSYVLTASMTDPTTGGVVQGTSLSVDPSNTPLVIATTGPTVAGVSFVPTQGRLNVVFQTGPASINLAGLVNANNYSLAFAQGYSVTPLAPTGIATAAGPNGTVSVSITYNLGRRISAGTYVVTLNALGLTDLAGNILNETHFVTFPQTTNSPNPNYVAAITVASNLTASAPIPYVSYPEQVAANNYNNTVRGSRVIRAASVPKPSRFRRG